ncbi:MAG: hypothetical protein GXN99_02555 [Candidatus Nanohaloarchaeota archaeon]|nr:hypothetical protein [Candidatus Nanohaloarchaeota archaeon]
MAGKSKRKVLWGVVLALVGFIWLAKDLGWLKINIPIIPLIVLIIGIWWIIEGLF